MTLLSLLGRLTLGHVPRFEDSASGGFQPVETCDDIAGANVVTSLRTDSNYLFFGEDVPMHAVVLDLDVPAYLIPSSTPGHSHLYIDVEIEEELYFKLLDVLAEARVVEAGYVGASKRRGSTCLRLPWVKKEAVA